VSFATHSNLNLSAAYLKIPLAAKLTISAWVPVPRVAGFRELADAEILQPICSRELHSLETFPGRAAIRERQCPETSERGIGENLGSDGFSEEKMIGHRLISEGEVIRRRLICEVSERANSEDESEVHELRKARDDQGRYRSISSDEKNVPEEEDCDDLIEGWEECAKLFNEEQARIYGDEDDLDLERVETPSRQSALPNYQREVRVQGAEYLDGLSYPITLSDGAPISACEPIPSDANTLSAGQLQRQTIPTMF
jgi:hypothetical protein